MGFARAAEEWIAGSSPAMTMWVGANISSL